MTTEELRFINEARKAFKEKFGRTLFIDMPRMNGVKCIRFVGVDVDIDRVQKVLEQRIEGRGANLKKIRSGANLNNAALAREKMAVLDFMGDILRNRWKIGPCMELINKDRTMFYHYRQSVIKLDDE